MNRRAYVVAVLLLLCGCEGEGEGPQIPKFDGRWVSRTPSPLAVGVTENGAGEITGSGGLGSYMFTVRGMHVHPDVSFTGWREGEFLTFKGEFTDDDTVEGRITWPGHEGFEVLGRESQ